MELVKIIADNIQNLLDTRRVSVMEISGFLGVSRQTMTNYLKASTVIDSVQLSKIADYFSVPIDSLFTPMGENNGTMPIFRTALNYSVAENIINDKVINYLNNYIELAQQCNKKYCFFPEQYNLTLNNPPKSMDINYECQNYFDSKLRINPELDSELLRIATEQRTILGLGDRGAIGLIPALIRRGINVIFSDFGNNNIFGFSICSDEKGCYIFVNSNANISIERQLFTLAHEYGHIILHRPVYKRKIQMNSETTNTNFLDKMADKFAGYLLSPNTMLSPYSSQITQIKNDFVAVCKFLLPLKLKFQVSLYSLLISFKNFGYIPSSTVTAYSNFININNIQTKELNEIREHKELLDLYNYEISSPITNMIHELYVRDLIDDTKAQEYLRLFKFHDEIKINTLLSEWKIQAQFGSTN